jgi:hypothetical protein
MEASAVRRLACPACGSTSLATVDDLTGDAYGEASDLRKLLPDMCLEQAFSFDY